jgi:hypothetical protein
MRGLGHIAQQLRRLSGDGGRREFSTGSPAVFVDKATRAICQGITGRNGTRSRRSTMAPTWWEA